MNGNVNNLLSYLYAAISYVLIIFFIFIVAIFISSMYSNGRVKAHPGNTASDGCHYCRTNCDYWGEVYGERHCHGGADISTQNNYVPSLSTQGNQNGQKHANETNRNYIESQANSEGSEDGNIDGYNANAKAYQSPDGDIVCSQVTFSSAQPKEYEDSFRQSYKTACINIYNLAYKNAYETAFNVASVKFSDDQLKLQTSKKASEPENSVNFAPYVLIGLLISGLVLLVSSNWEKIKEFFGN